MRNTTLVPIGRLIATTSLSMVAFAGNSLLCRLALYGHHINAASFTAVRLGSGAAMLGLLGVLRGMDPFAAGSWASASTLFVYAAGFSFAYVSLPVGSGALLLFGAVQATMIGSGLWHGERLSALEWMGFGLAIAGLSALLAPGTHAAPVGGSILMICAGIAWGLYSLRGRSAADPTLMTTGNFLRAAPMVLALYVWEPGLGSTDLRGIAYAIVSGVLASAVGYTMWYAALRHLQSTSAAVIQLSVPAIAAVGGFVLLGEPLTVRLIVTAGMILGGIAIVLVGKRHQR